MPGYGEIDTTLMVHPPGEGNFSWGSKAMEINREQFLNPQYRDMWYSIDMRTFSWVEDGVGGRSLRLGTVLKMYFTCILTYL